MVTPAELVATWKQRFPEFWPDGNRFYAPLTGIEPGDVALLNLAMPGRLTLSTGVMVLYSDEESFTLMTPQGHMFAGWITFSSTERDGCTVAQTQVLMRASDPVFELGLALGGHAQEDRFWQQTLRNVAASFEVHDAVVETRVVCVDPKRQWSRWTNVRHSAAIRSSVWMLGAPVARHPPAAAPGARGGLRPGQRGAASQGSVRSRYCGSPSEISCTCCICSWSSGGISFASPSRAAASEVK